MIRNALYTLGTIVCLLILGLVLLRTPDTDIRQMETKYGLGKVQRVCYGEQGNCVHVREDGNSNGAPIILLHGSNDSLLTWRPLADRLGTNYRILTIDLPGHGLSGPHSADDYSARAMIDAVSALATHYKAEQFYLGGNSMGGWVAWRYALALPERVQGLILMDASGAPLPEGSPPAKIYLGARLMNNPMIRPLVKYITPRSIVRKSIEDSVFDPSMITEKLVTQYWELLRYPGNRRATALRAMTNREPQLADRLPEIAVPTLILWGKADRVVPVGVGEAFDRLIANSQLIIYDNAGHLPQLEVPDRVATDIDGFIRTLSDGG